METSQWNKVADEHGFIFVYPSGTTLRGKGTGVLTRPSRSRAALEVRVTSYYL